MTKLSSATATATATNPVNLPARYDIRRLTQEHLPFALAIVLHSNMFYSPVWPIVYPENKTARLYEAFPAGEYLIRHQIESGYSFGVFDLEYQFKRTESKPDGRLYWDMQDTTLDADQLLAQMDFPLVSVAMAYDGIKPLDKGRVMPLIACLPLFGTFYHVLETLDPRPEASWKPTAEKQLMLRNATSTRHDAEGKGLMKALAQSLMRYAHGEGFKAIQIECFADAVTKVWSEPPPFFRSTVISEFNTAELEVEEEVDGVKRKVKPYGDNCRQRATKIYCELRSSEPNGTAVK